MGLYEKLSEHSYIKKLFLGIDERFTERFLQIKKNYETTQDKEDKRLYRDQLSNLFWELYPMVAKMINPELSTAKRLFLRYGLTDLRNLSPEDQKFILNQPVQPVNYQEETIFYADEWLQGVADGKIKASAGDETQEKSSPLPQQIDAKQEKYIALLEVENRRFKEFKKNRDDVLQKLTHVLAILKESYIDPNTHHEGIYNTAQNKSVDEIVDLHRDLRRINKEIVASARTMRKAQDSLDEINGTESDLERIDTSFEKEKIVSEVSNIRQMVKMTVGRKGNMFPFLTSGFLSQERKNYLFKDTLKKKLNQWLSLDPEAFNRTYKGETMNIMPYMILVPGYGQTGVCWEPLDRNNKQFGRGRMVFPIFTKTPDLTVLTGIGDMRWQAAKEIASYYWMEEGLTGRYYEYYLGAKLKGDLKTLFITDYLLWMSKETQGVQKLEQNARYVFWRYVPLPDENKIQLSKKGYYYNQLWEKEQVWRQNKDR